MGTIVTGMTVAVRWKKYNYFAYEGTALAGDIVNTINNVGKKNLLAEFLPRGGLPKGMFAHKRTRPSFCGPEDTPNLLSPTTGAVLICQQYQLCATNIPTGGLSDCGPGEQECL